MGTAPACAGKAGGVRALGKTEWGRFRARASARARRGGYASGGCESIGKATTDRIGVISGGSYGVSRPIKGQAAALEGASVSASEGPDHAPAKLVNVVSVEEGIGEDGTPGTMAPLPPRRLISRGQSWSWGASVARLRVRAAALAARR